MRKRNGFDNIRNNLGGPRDHGRDDIYRIQASCSWELRSKFAACTRSVISSPWKLKSASAVLGPQPLCVFRSSSQRRTVALWSPIIPFDLFNLTSFGGTELPRSDPSSCLPFSRFVISRWSFDVHGLKPSPRCDNIVVSPLRVLQDNFHSSPLFPANKYIIERPVSKRFFYITHDDLDEVTNRIKKELKQ